MSKNPSIQLSRDPSIPVAGIQASKYRIDKYQNMDPKGHGEQQSQAQAENELKGALRRYKVRHWKSLSVWTVGCWPLTLSHLSHPNFTVFKLDTEASQSCVTFIK